MAGDSQQMRILEKIDTGDITPEEGLRQLQALRGGPDDAGAMPAASVSPPGGAGQPPPGQGAETGRRWWIVPACAGIGLIIVGGLLMNWALQASGFGWQLLCAAVPFAAGVGITALAWGVRRKEGLQIRINIGGREGAA